MRDKEKDKMLVRKPFVKCQLGWEYIRMDLGEKSREDGRWVELPHWRDLVAYEQRSTFGVYYNSDSLVNFRNCLKGLSTTTKSISKNRRPLSRQLNQDPLRFEAGAISTQPWRRTNFHNQWWVQSALSQLLSFVEVVMVYFLIRLHTGLLFSLLLRKQ